MALKKKNKILAQFNMSSLTDIIFLLLIFFMLTSSLIVPNALNLKLPGSASHQTISKQPDRVKVDANGKYYYNGSSINRDDLFSALRTLKNNAGTEKANLTIAPDRRVSNQYVVEVLDMAYQLNINAILVEPK